MKVTIQQPDYLPGLSFFDRMDQVDLIVLDDDAHQNRRGGNHRGMIKRASSVLPLNVPISPSNQTLRNTYIDNRKSWREQHWKSIESSYGKAKYWSKYQGVVHSIYQHEWTFLSDLNIHAIFILKEAFSIQTSILVASEMDQAFGQGSERIHKLCGHLGAKRFLSKEGERVDIKALQGQGITLIQQKYSHPEYPQLGGSFLPRLSALDLLFNCGPDSLEIIRKGRE